MTARMRWLAVWLAWQLGGDVPAAGLAVFVWGQKFLDAVGMPPSSRSSRVAPSAIDSARSRRVATSCD